MWCRSIFLAGGLWYAAVSAQSLTSDSLNTISLSGTMGSAFTVPKDKIWKVESLFCSAGSYNVKVTSVKFKAQYLAGEKITLPAWCAEAELLDAANSSSLMYLLKLRESYK